MKILVFTHPLVVGGVSVNCIELAARLRDSYKQDVVIFANAGPMLRVVRDAGIRFINAPHTSIHPSYKRIASLRQLVRRERPDIIHAWEWPQCLDAYFGVYLPWSVPLAVSDMMMTVNRVLPKRVPMTFGIPELADRAKAQGRGPIETIVPPVDVQINAPDAVSSSRFREQHGIADGNITVVTVSRLDEHLKAESISRTIDVIRNLGGRLPLKFIVVGDGPERSRFQRMATDTNTYLGRSAVVLAGEVLDPRPAYAAADIVVGMGGSALRGMAFSKPVIIVGKRGFAATLSPETSGMFYDKGIYGEGARVSGKDLELEVISLATNEHKRAFLGAFSRQFVVDKFSLGAVCEKLMNFLELAKYHSNSRQTNFIDGARTSAMYLRDRVFLWRSVHWGQSRETRDVTN